MNLIKAGAIWFYGVVLILALWTAVSGNHPGQQFDI